MSHRLYVLLILIGLLSALPAHALDPPVHQVLVETRFVVVNPDFSRELGIQWQPLPDLSPGPWPGTGGTLQGGVPYPNGVDLDRLLEALLREQGNEVLAQPRITLDQGQPGTIGLTEDLQLPAREGIPATRFKDFGIRIQVTPEVTAGGGLQMKLDTEVDRLDPAGTATAGSMPQLSTRRAVTQVALSDGETVVLGGLLQDRDLQSAAQDPWLENLARLDRLFRNQDVQDGRRELLVIITPQLVQAHEDENQDESGTGSAAGAAGAAAASAASVVSAAGSAKAAAGSARSTANRSGSASAGTRDTPPVNNCMSDTDLQTQSLGQKPNFAQQFARGLPGQMLGRLTGGGLFGGGEPESEAGDQGTVDPNPFKNQPGATVTFGDGMRFDVQANSATTRQVANADPLEDFGAPRPVSETAGMTFGVRPDLDALKNRKLVFSNLFLLSPDCRQVQPAGRYIYEIWQDSQFRFRVEFWHWRNGQLVEHWTASGSEAWSKLLASGALPTWVGARFDGIRPETLAQGGWSLVTSWTYEQGGEVMLESRVFDIHGGSGGESGDFGDSHNRAVPGLSKTPMVGALFRSDKAADEREGLILSVTPRILQDSD